MRKNRAMALIAGAAVAAATIAGCSGTPQFDDLKNVNPVYPDYAVVVMNVDGFPNVTILCYDGQAMLTTTRDYEPLTVDPAFDNICAAHLHNDLNAVGAVAPPAGPVPDVTAGGVTPPPSGVG